jgi:ABC-type transport system involved in multi-copper enzyme maturation permease subunit
MNNDIKPMLALLIKDIRLNTIPILGGGLLMAMPYIIILLSIPMQHHDRSDIPREFQVAAAMGIVLTVAVAAIFGGVAFALERRERSADFLALLPVTRRQIVTSKILVGLFFPVLMLIANFIALTIASRRLQLGDQNAFAVDNVQFIIVAAALILAFGIAWLASSFLSSPAIAAGISITMILCWLFVSNVLPEKYIDSVPGAYQFAVGFSAIIVPGLICFCVGTYYYLNRIEP